VERDSTLLVKWPKGAGEDGAPARRRVPCAVPRALAVRLSLHTYLGHGPSKGAPWVGRTTVWHVRASACASACLRAAPQPLCYHRATRLGSEATAPVSRLGSEATAPVSHGGSRTAEELLVDTHSLRRLRARGTQSSCQPKAPLWTAHDQGMYVVKGGRRGRGALHKGRAGAPSSPAPVGHCTSRVPSRSTNGFPRASAIRAASLHGRRADLQAGAAGSARMRPRWPARPGAERRRALAGPLALGTRRALFLTTCAHARRAGPGASAYSQSPP